MKKLAIIASFVELDQVSSLTDCAIITFKKSISVALDHLGVSHTCLSLSMYDEGHVIKKFHDLLLIWKTFRKSELIVFVNHDCIATALAIRFAEHVKFRDRYPHVDLTGDKLPLSALNKFISWSFNLKIEVRDEHGLEIKSFDRLIQSKAKIEEPLSTKNNKGCGDKKPKLIFVCDDHFCRDSIYLHQIDEALHAISKRFPTYKLVVKHHPRNNGGPELKFRIGKILPSEIPVEIMIGRNDILIGLYSSLFENIKDIKIISILNFIDPKRIKHIALKRHMLKRMERIPHENI